MAAARLVVFDCDGTLVDTSGRTSSHNDYAGADARVFNIGIQSGTFFTKDTNPDDDDDDDGEDELSAEFLIEVSQ